MTFFVALIGKFSASRDVASVSIGIIWICTALIIVAPDESADDVFVVHELRAVLDSVFFFISCCFIIIQQ